MGDRSGYWLTLMLIASLILFSVTGIYGIYEYNKESRLNKNWRLTSGYREFIGKMNLLSVPAIILMMASLAICIPRRIINPRYMALVTGVVVSIFVVYLLIYPLRLALGVFFLSLLFIQLIVLFFTIAGKELIYRKDIRLARIGSALLHFSLTLFLVDVTIVGSEMHMALFWLAGAGFMTGNIMSFYGR